MKQKKVSHTVFLLVLLFLAVLFLFPGASVQPAKAATKSVPRLYVKGNHLEDKNGKTVQLKGVSTHGIAWYPQYVNKKAFKTLKKDWHANTIRLAMYTEEYGGYTSGGDQKELKKLIKKGVRYATDLGMYVIIDWHILNDNDPLTHQEDAEKFFKWAAKTFRKNTNVLFELCNEPHWVSWKDYIRPYAAKITKIIRKYHKTAVIIVGTNTWSQDVDEVIGNTLPDKNTVYTLHFYAATHGDDLRKKMENALKAKVPVFISECSICEASGNGTIDKTSAKKWFSLIKKYHVSYIAWNLSNKDEASSLIAPTCSKLSGWKPKELSATGKWFRKQMRK